MSTRSEIRAAISARVITALPAASIIDDPDPGAASRDRTSGLLVQLIWGGIAYDANQLLGEAHDQSETWTWEIQIIVPASGTAAEDIAEAALTAIRTQLCPATGWRPSAPGEIDCDVMNVASEEYVGDPAKGQRLYVATYTHGRSA